MQWLLRALQLFISNLDKKEQTEKVQITTTTTTNIQPNQLLNFIQWSLVYVSEFQIQPAWLCDNKLNLYDRLLQWVKLQRLISSVGGISQAWQISSDRESTASTLPANRCLSDMKPNMKDGQQQQGTA